MADLSAQEPSPATVEIPEATEAASSFRPAGCSVFLAYLGYLKEKIWENDGN